MEYTLTIPEALHGELLSHFAQSRNEAAAYLLCGQSESEQEKRLLVRRIIPVRDQEIASTSPVHMSIPSASFRAAMKEAHQTKSSFLFAHSHPNGLCDFSQQDDKEEALLFRTAYNRIRTAAPHGSIVIARDGSLVGRIWLEDGTSHPFSKVRIIGSSFRFFYPHSANPPLEFFDRHVRAFGIEFPQILRQLHIGIIGCGGTGSSIAEQLIRLGVGTLTVVDEGRFEASNVTRGYGSSVLDVGAEKVELIKRLATTIGMGTRVITINKNCTYASTIRSLRACDLIFGCTDDQWGRSLLNRLAIYYFIPVLDMGVRIHSQAGKIRSVQGRVTTLLPNMACLYCRNRISAEVVRQESLDALNPTEAARLRKEGYIPELEEPAAALISFTTSIAAAAVNELFHRITQFGGADRTATEILYRFDESKISTNSTPSQPDCICGNPTLAGRGDCEPLLDCTWRPE